MTPFIPPTSRLDPPEYSTHAECVSCGQRRDLTDMRRTEPFDPSSQDYICDDCHANINAWQDGYDAAKFDGFDTFALAVCQCRECRKLYYEGVDRAQLETT